MSDPVGDYYLQEDNVEDITEREFNIATEIRYEPPFNEIVEEFSSDGLVVRAVLMPVPLVPVASTSATSAFGEEPPIFESTPPENDDPSTAALQPDQQTDPQLERDDQQHEQEGMAEDDRATARTSRKRTRNVSNWAKNVAKRARQAGEAYVSVYKDKSQEGKLIASRSIRPGCHEKCRNKCRTYLSEEDRILLFKEFWAIETHKEKWEYLARRVDTCPVKDRKTHWESRRNESRSYSFRSNGRVVKVCKVMFLDTLDINEQWVKTALLKQGMGSALESDNRGKNCGRRTLNSDLVANVKEHIQLFPKVPSHYCRKDSNRDYLDENLSLPKMYTFYEAWMKKNRPAGEHKFTFATYRQYKDIFDREFNLHFFKPKKDQCDVCYAWKHATPDERLELQASYDTHIGLKNLAQKMKNENKKTCNKDSSSCVACFDMQKVLPSPRAESSAFYYKRHLSVYNFTVYDCTRHDGFCYMWNETIGSKGSNEIASFLLDFIEKKVETGVKKFFFYSDNCAGQNKNQFVFSMMYLAAVRHNIEITYRFLETGHTQNEGDSMHALIEKRSKNVTIHSPEDWISIVKTAKKAGSKQYDVTEVIQENIYNFKEFAKHLQWEKDMDGNKVGLSKIRELYVNSNLDPVVEFKHHFSEESKRLDVTSGTGGRSINLSSYTLKKAYRGLLPIDKAKLADLKALCARNLIPSEKHAFYNALRVKNSSEF
ncbi:hypothetical protein evm_015350 [Chilo suppressalis]|nr:hypothetical protein evm_015350 [Chilo suppressalis]